MRVLLIEDEPTTAKAIELMLTAEGFNVYSTDLGEEGVKPFIQHIGLFNSKGRHIQETCRLLLEKHGGEVPQNREDLEALGRRTKQIKGES